jgi:hypothetical protein
LCQTRLKLSWKLDECKPLHLGLEEVVAAELRSPLIGASDVSVGASGVSFAGPPKVGRTLFAPVYCHQHSPPSGIV